MHGILLEGFAMSAAMLPGAIGAMQNLRASVLRPRRGLASRTLEPGIMARL